MAEKAKYIDVKELSIILDTMKNPDSEFATDDYIDGFSDGISAAIKELEAFPTADVAPVVHGRWVYNPNGMDWNLGAWQCSVCKCNNNNLPGNDKHNPYIFQGSNYCPNCGAKMDGKDGESDENKG